MFRRLVMSLSVVLLLIGDANAEQKLLVTDVLDGRQREVSLDFTWGSSSYDFTRKLPTYQQGRVRHDNVTALFSYNTGLFFDGFELQISLPYVIQDRQSYTYVSPSLPGKSISDEGTGNEQFGAKYRVLGGGNEPFTLVAGVTVTPSDSTSTEEGRSTMDIGPYLAAGTSMNDNSLRPYVSYQALLRNHGASDSHQVTLGAEYVVNSAVSLVPSLYGIFWTTSASLSAYESYALSLSSFLQLFNNFYLTPHVEGGVTTSAHSLDGSLNNGTLKYVEAGLGLYYLFN